MATTNKNKIKDFFNQFSNPSGGFGSSMAPRSNPYASSMFANRGQNPLSSFFAGFSPRQSGPAVPFGENMSRMPAGAGAPAPVAAPAVAAPVNPSRAPVAAPVAAPAVAQPQQAQVPKQWMKADGSIKTPDEIVADMASTLKSSAQAGDVGRLAADQFSGVNKSAEELATEARKISNVRNDIAVGESDPYRVASRSGIAFTPEQLGAIEKAYAGIYDPALAGAMSKLEAKQKADEESAQWERDLNKISILHKNDLEKMETDFGYQKIIEGMKIAAQKAKEAGVGGISPYQEERSIRTVQSVDELLGQVNNWTTGFGSLLSSIPTSDARSFKAQLDTLKSSIAFGELTAMREASKTGGALGNVSNIELGLLENAMGALDRAQKPEEVRIQLTKIKDSINRWRQAQGSEPLGTNSSQGVGTIVTAPNGTLVQIID